MVWTFHKVPQVNNTKPNRTKLNKGFAVLSDHDMVTVFIPYIYANIVWTFLEFHSTRKHESTTNQKKTQH